MRNGFAGFYSLFGWMPVTKVPSHCIRNEKELASIAVALGAREVSGWSEGEEMYTRNLPSVPNKLVNDMKYAIRFGHDPLGELFCRLRTPIERRERGATYTPSLIVEAMLKWAVNEGRPTRVVDPGVGSGRYLLAAGRNFNEAALFGVEVDPLAALLARANLAVAGFASRAKIVVGDFRDTSIPVIAGRTLYVGNPPYIRHHRIEQKWKQWLIDEASKCSLSASQLAGMHVHFFMATVAKAAKNDFGAFITSAEWLDVNYGSIVRDLFVGKLGGKRIVVIEPTAMPFPDAATTAAVTYFEIGSHSKSVYLKRVESVEKLADPSLGRKVRRERLEAESRWTHLTRSSKEAPASFIELGEICRVHRGQVTGKNSVWIAGEHSADLPDSVLFPSVTRAHELFRAGNQLIDGSILRRVIDLPVDLALLEAGIRRKVEVFLTKAKLLGAHIGYVAQNRRAWWSVGLRHPAPILATYMARRPPAFVRNTAEARHINIAHGLYPRETFSEQVLDALARYLSKAVSLAQGRTYAGGLTKFEPREMERLMVPPPHMLKRAEFQ